MMGICSEWQQNGSPTYIQIFQKVSNVFPAYSILKCEIPAYSRKVIYYSSIVVGVRSKSIPIIIFQLATYMLYVSITEIIQGAAS
jgi:hypothetical protein